MIGPKNSDCWRPIVGPSRAPFSCARCRTSVAVITRGFSTRIWNSVTRNESFTALRFWSDISIPIGRFPPAWSGCTSGVPSSRR